MKLAFIVAATWRARIGVAVTGVARARHRRVEGTRRAVGVISEFVVNAIESPTRVGRRGTIVFAVKQRR